MPGLFKKVMFNFSPHHKPIIHIKHENNNHLPRHILQKLF
jgi:hypothetical protein